MDVGTTLDALRWFAALRDAPTLAEAGRRVGLGPSGVSAALKRLERDQGVRLVERTTRHFRLTPEGEIFLATCERMLAVWSEGELALQSAHEGVAGPLRVSAPVDLGQTVGTWLAALGRAHPGLQVSLLTADALHDLAADAIDIALRYGHPEASSLVARRLAGGERWLVASPAYLARAGAPEHPRALSTHRCLGILGAGHPPTRWGLHGPEGPLEVPIVPALSAHGAQVRRWAVQGEGIALKSALDLVDDLEAGRLVRVLPGWGEAVPLHALMPSRRYRARRVQEALRHLAEGVRSLEARLTALGA